MIEIHKEIQRYRAHIEHNATGVNFELRAVVEEIPDTGRFNIRYSHTFKPEGAAGPYYSNTFTLADSAAEAEAKVLSWSEQLSESPEICPWSDI